MAEERVQRRLAAILAADVVGYSRLMAEGAVPRNLFREILWRIDDLRQKAYCLFAGLGSRLQSCCGLIREVRDHAVSSAI